MAKKTIICDNIEYDIGYEMVNLEKTDTILFLHGWGASKSIMKQAFGQNFKDYRLLFVDLPGFGSSSIVNPLDSYGYTKIINCFLNSINSSPKIIFGHSFGGKIATLLKPDKLVLLSSAGIVIKKSFKVRVKIKFFKLIKKFGFKDLYVYFASKDVNKMSKTMYETFKKVVDERFDEHFLSFKGESLIFWGIEDKATPIKSGQTIHKLIKNSKFFPLQGNHFFFLTQNENISNIVKENLCM